MKKFKIIFAVLSIMCFVVMSGCFTNDEDEDNSNVNVSYAGVQTVNPLHPLNVEFYTSAADLLNSDLNAYQWDLCISFYYKPYSDTIDETDLNYGTYYILAYVDVNNNEKIDAGEPYIIYNNQKNSGTPTAFVFNSTAKISLSFNDVNPW